MGNSGYSFISLETYPAIGHNLGYTYPATVGYTSDDVHQRRKTSHRRTIVTTSTNSIAKNLSNLSSLITCLPNRDKDFPVNLFWNLVEWKAGVRAINIFNSSITCLESYRIINQYLKIHLISLSCGDVAVMLGGRANGG